MRLGHWLLILTRFLRAGGMSCIIRFMACAACLVYSARVARYIIFVTSMQHGDVCEYPLHTYSIYCIP